MIDDISMQQAVRPRDETGRFVKQPRAMPYSLNPDLKDVRDNRKHAYANNGKMKKIGLSVKQETFDALLYAKERRGMANVNELIRFYIGKALIEDKKYFIDNDKKVAPSSSK